MKKILLFVIGVTLMAACQQDVIYEVDYNVLLDAENTYYAGEPVKFNIAGEVDNILFYSGETGSQYEYRNRFEVTLDQVRTATLHLEINGQYGDKGALELYVSKDFSGLDGANASADRATIQAMVDNGMTDWVKLTVTEEENKFVAHDFPMNDYLENMCVALHWCPKTNTKIQRTYRFKGHVNLELDGVEPLKMDLLDLGFVSFMMDKNFENDPYAVSIKKEGKRNGNGCIRYDLAAAPIVFQGIAAYKEENPENGGLPYALDGWLISTPAPLNKVSNDKGVVIKNLQNYLHSYEYTWEKPGTYEVVFVGRNENYAAASEQVFKYTINILEKPEL